MHEAPKFNLWGINYELRITNYELYSRASPNLLGFVRIPSTPESTKTIITYEYSEYNFCPGRRSASIICLKSLNKSSRCNDSVSEIFS